MTWLSRQRCLLLQSYRNWNEWSTLFILEMMVLYFLDKGRMVNSGRMFIVSLVILVVLHSTCFSYRAVRVEYFKPVTDVTDVYKALQIITVFLTDAPKTNT